MTTGKTIALTIQTSVDKVMSLLFNMLSRLVIAFLPRSRHLLISCLQSPSVVLLESKKKNKNEIRSLLLSISYISLWYWTLESPLACKEIKPINHKGNQS